MSGPQYAHIQTWSRKPNPRGQSVQQVIDEALREPGFCGHVDDPAPPRVLLGDPRRFQADHDAHVAARATVVRMQDGTEKVRSIRQDRHTMASIVMSYPVPRVAIVTEEARQKLAAWERRNMEWLQQTYGDQLRVVMAHEDEAQPHLHAWLLPDDPGAEATTLHPGKLAKRAVEADAKAKGQAPREAVKAGNRALKAAMTEWQDTYYHAVGAPEGLTRTGPLRRRLTREQWKAEKAAARATAQAVMTAQAEADRIVERASVVAKATEALAGELAAGTLRRNDDGKLVAAVPSALQAGGPALMPAIHAAADARAAIERDRAEAKRLLSIAESAQAAAEAKFAEAEASHAAAQAKHELLAEQENKLNAVVRRVRAIIEGVGHVLGLQLPRRIGEILNMIEKDVEQRIVSAPPEPTDPISQWHEPGF